MPGHPSIGRWDPCFVDPWRGIAHFDGITIEADPITSARPDRVLPCVADEQVFFCRMLRHVLAGTRVRGKERKRKALDFGTGSGVLGIAGAALGLEVRGVDVSQRALAYAAFNTNQNKTAIERGGGTLELPEEVSDAFADEGLDKGAWDYILLNPPFAPVRADWQAPNSVNAGPDGQDFLLRSVHRAAELLKPGGRLFAVHLLLTEEDGRPAVLEKSDALNPTDWESLIVFPAFPMSPLYPLDEFRRQTWGQIGTEAVTPGAHLCLAFIELRKRQGRSERAVNIRFETQVPVAPTTNWQSRIAMHRAVLNASPRCTPDSPKGNRDSQKENGSPSNALLPAGAYFLDSTTPFLGDEADTQAERSRSAGTSIHRALLHWVQANDLIAFAGTGEGGQDAGSYFDTIMIEAAPWYLSKSANLELRSSTSLICPTEKAEQATAALKEVLQSIQRINSENRSIFRHREQEDRATSRWHTAIAANFPFKTSELPGVTPDGQAIANLDTPSWSEVGTIGAACQEAMLNSLEVRPDNPSEIPFDHCLERAMRDFTDVVARNGLVRGPAITCYIAGVPLPPTHMDRPDDASGSLETAGSQQLDEKRTGIVYVYGWSSRLWSPAAESELTELARIAALMHEEDYANAAEVKLQQLWKESAYKDALGTAKHELAYVVAALKHALAPEATELLRMLLGAHLLLDDPDPLVFLNKLARSPATALASLWADCFVAHRIAKESRGDNERLQEWRTEAMKLVPEDAKVLPEGAARLGSLALSGVVAPTKQQQLRRQHFYASLIAAMSNAAKFANDPDFKKREGTISFQVSPNFVDVSTTYWYGDDRQLADDVYRYGKQTLANKAKRREGTENVLRYHAAKYGVSTEDRLVIPDRLPPSTPHQQEGIRWTSRIPLIPTDGEEQAP